MTSPNNASTSRSLSGPADRGAAPALPAPATSMLAGAGLPSDEMDAAHTADYHGKAKLDALRRQIEAFLSDPPAGLWPRTRDALGMACMELKRESDHVTAAWD